MEGGALRGAGLEAGSRVGEPVRSLDVGTPEVVFVCVCPVEEETLPRRLRDVEFVFVGGLGFRRERVRVRDGPVDVAIM